MTPEPDALDRRRADLTAEIDHLTAYIEGEQQRLACLHARLEEVDVVRALMRVKMDEPAVATPKRRNIAAEVYKAITGAPQTISEIARSVGNVKLSAVENAIRWHLDKGNVAHCFPLNGQARYVRADGASLQEAAE